MRPSRIAALNGGSVHGYHVGVALEHQRRPGAVAMQRDDVGTRRVRVLDMHLQADGAAALGDPLRRVGFAQILLRPPDARDARQFLHPAHQLAVVNVG